MSNEESSDSIEIIGDNFGGFFENTPPPKKQKHSNYSNGDDAGTAKSKPDTSANDSSPFDNTKGLEDPNGSSRGSSGSPPDLRNPKNPAKTLNYSAVDKSKVGVLPGPKEIIVINSDSDEVPRVEIVSDFRSDSFASKRGSNGSISDAQEESACRDYNEVCLAKRKALKRKNNEELLAWDEERNQPHDGGSGSAEEFLEKKLQGSDYTDEEPSPPTESSESYEEEESKCHVCLEKAEGALSCVSCPKFCHLECLGKKKKKIKNASKWQCKECKFKLKVEEKIECLRPSVVACSKIELAEVDEIDGITILSFPSFTKEEMVELEKKVKSIKRKE